MIRLEFVVRMSLQEGEHFFLYLNDGQRRYGLAKKNAYFVF